jgi:hypothetical protein
MNMKPSGKVSLEIILEECEDAISDEDMNKIKKLIRKRKRLNKMKHKNI